jgi:hypothetical protein
MHPDSLPMPDAIDGFTIVTDRIPGWPERREKTEAQSQSFAQAFVFPLTIVPKVTR